MNKTRRKEISNLISSIEGVAENVSTFHGWAEGIQSEEQDYFDEMPENFQSSERGEIAEAAAEKLQEAVDALDAAKDAMQEAIDALWEAG